MASFWSSYRLIHFLFLAGIHSQKHERLPSFYTTDEVKRVLNAVDRSTPWGKTAYLMMLLACVYGLRSSDIKALIFSGINWKKTNHNSFTIQDT